MPRGSPDVPPTSLAPRGVIHRGSALALSLLAHAALATALVHEGNIPARVAADSRQRPVEITAPELEPPSQTEEARVTNPAPPALEPMKEHEHPIATRPAPRAPAVENPRTGTPEPAVVTAAATAAAPRFVMTAAPAFEASPSPTTGNATATSGSSTAAPLAEREVDVGPVLLAGAPPAYPASAQAAGVEASVPVELVIDARGAVTSVVVLAHVGYGLDEAAVAALRGYRFTPARRGGHPVAVRKRWITRFELR